VHHQKPLYEKEYTIIISSNYQHYCFLLFSGLECNEKNDPEGECLYFRSFKIAWKDTPVDPLDRPLNPEEHIIQVADNYYWFNYKPSDYIEKVCMKEATIVTFIIKVKEEFYQQFATDHTLVYDNFGFQDIDWSNSTSNGIFTSVGSKTIDGNPAGGETNMELGISVVLQNQGDATSTIEFYKNAVVEVVIDWAYTEY
jgi:hypothetical protein|tara:strand:+ start:34 stop:627 length:594 start_codon:yes stop_codon:yes gene_type:complete